MILVEFSEIWRFPRFGVELARTARGSQNTCPGQVQTMFIEPWTQLDLFCFPLCPSCSFEVYCFSLGFGVTAGVRRQHGYTCILLATGFQAASGFGS